MRRVAGRPGRGKALGDVGRLWTAGAAMLLSAACLAQKYVPPPPPLTVDPCAATVNPLLAKGTPARDVPVCTPAAAVKSPEARPGGATAADKFPFPGEAATGAKPSAAEQFPYPGSAAPPTAPSTTPGNKAGDRFPYPGETSASPDAVPEGDTPRYVPDGQAPDAPASGVKQPGGNDGASSSSSSSSSTSGGETPVAPAGEGGAGDEGAGARSHGRRALPKVSAVTPEDRVAEDLDVAKFYSDRGNFQAAYLRAKDAAKLMPEDPETHFALAQAADRLKRKDEAATEYAAYLKLDPSGEKKTVAQRALSQLR